VKNPWLIPGIGQAPIEIALGDEREETVNEINFDTFLTSPVTAILHELHEMIRHLWMRQAAAKLGYTLFILMPLMKQGDQCAVEAIDLATRSFGGGTLCRESSGHEVFLVRSARSTRCLTSVSRNRDGLYDQT